MIRWPENPTDDHERWAGFQRLMRIRGPLSSDEFEDILLDRGVVSLGSKVSDVFWPVGGRVSWRLGCGRVRHCRSGGYR